MAKQMFHADFSFSPIIPCEICCVMFKWVCAVLVALNDLEPSGDMMSGQVRTAAM